MHVRANENAVLACSQMLTKTIRYNKVRFFPQASKFSAHLSSGQSSCYVICLLVYVFKQNANLGMPSGKETHRYLFKTSHGSTCSKGKLAVELQNNQINLAFPVIMYSCV